MIEKIWKDPVWSKVIASAIIGLIILTSNYYLNWWHQLQNIITKFYTYLNNYSEVKNWIILLMGICTLLIILFIIYSIWSLVFQTNSEENWKKYKKDDFYELEWHWEYNLFDNQPYNFYTLCPHCKFQIYPRLDHSNDTLKYTCENCNTNFQPINESSYSNLEHKIILKIQHKLRTNTFDKNR